jgi:hypothetical protein
VTFQLSAEEFLILCGLISAFAVKFKSRENIYERNLKTEFGKQAVNMIKVA